MPQAPGCPRPQDAPGLLAGQCPVAIALVHLQSFFNSKGIHKDIWILAPFSTVGSLQPCGNAREMNAYTRVGLHNFVHMDGGEAAYASTIESRARSLSAFRSLTHNKMSLCNLVQLLQGDKHILAKFKHMKPADMLCQSFG